MSNHAINAKQDSVGEIVDDSRARRVKLDKTGECVDARGVGHVDVEGWLARQECIDKRGVRQDTSDQSGYQSDVVERQRDIPDDEEDGLS